MAKCYWNNGPSPNGDTPIWETLVDGDIEIVEIVEEVNQNIYLTVTMRKVTACRKSSGRLLLFEKDLLTGKDPPFISVITINETDGRHRSETVSVCIKQHERQITPKHNIVYGCNRQGE